MSIKKLVVESATVFAVALVAVALVTFLWNLMSHGAGAIDWETSFRFAILFGIIQTWIKAREIKEKRIFTNSWLKKLFPKESNINSCACYINHKIDFYSRRLILMFKLGLDFIFFRNRYWRE